MAPSAHEIVPATALLEPFDRPQRQWLMLPLVLSVAALFWAAIGLGSYSGAGVPPLFGDFEAQRHWMELTQHLPPSQWYFYDLSWWGLDYPPLTAYHSWVLGKLGSWMDPSWFELGTSRGIESPQLKAYMRNTVLASQFLVYVPAVVLYVRQVASELDLSVLSWATSLAIILLQPSLALIDNGHFQYNAVMLGFVVLSVAALKRGHVFRASVAFVLSLMFKQMALYYAPVIFAYILGHCVFPRLSIKTFSAAALGVILPTAACLWPFRDVSQLAQVAHRVFPVARGLWEDKVANLWCTINTVVKLRETFGASDLQKISLVTTVVAILPACVVAFYNFSKPGTAQSPQVLVWALSICAWSFYLFSFQVHEKSVLLPLLPTTLLLAHGNFQVSAMVLWINNIAYFSMWPLLHRDGLDYQYFTVLVLWNWLANAPARIPRGWLNILVVWGSYMAIAAASVAFFFDLVPLAHKYPDLLVVVNQSISFACFAYFWLWLHVQLPGSSHTKTEK